MNTAFLTIHLPCVFTRRNIQKFVSLMTTIKSEVLIIKDGRSAPAKSMIGLISLCCNQGDEITINCRSRDSDAQFDLNRVVEILNTIEQL